MGQVSKVLRNGDGMYSHWCPGCERMHYINTEADGGPVWSFDGNVDQPTFGPSVKITYNGPGRRPAARRQSSTGRLLPLLHQGRPDRVL